MVRPLLLALVSLLSYGCTTTKAIAPEPDDPRTPNQLPTQTPTTTPPPPVTASPPDDNDKGPNDEARIGQPCKPGEKACGTKGRVATGFVQSTNPRKKLTAPCEMPVRDPNEPVTFGDHALGCVKDDRVYVHGSCLECRIYSEWMWVGLVAEMTDPQLDEAQRRAQVPKEPLLKTTAAWKAALASPPAKRKR